MRFLKLILVLFPLFISVESLQAQHRLDCIVLDPGHGGKDPGGVSLDKKTREKDIVLDIARRLGSRITQRYGDSIKVLYTRRTDEFIPLQGRADFANRHNADLFISIHINANRSSKPSGHSVHVLGPSSDPSRDLKDGNLSVCQRENSVILLEDDYKTSYQGFDPADDASYIFMTLMQSAFYEQSIYFASLVEDALSSTGPIANRRGVEQNPFYVLWKTSMPAVLLELGFITNDDDLAHLKRESDLDRIADCILSALDKYKVNYDESLRLALGNSRL